jgi:SNF2 family DNA or RNA helicase
VHDPDTGECIRPKRVVQINKFNPKVEAVVEMLTAEDRDPLGKTIVWCHWVEDIMTIHARLEELGIDHGVYYGGVSQVEREKTKNRFNNDPNCRVLVCNPQTAGEGLNLIGYDKTDESNSNTYTDHEVFFSQNWSSILRGQAEDRAHRKGTRMPVRITDLEVLGTIDEEIRKRVRMKQQQAMSVLEIRAILANVLNLEEDE